MRKRMLLASRLSAAALLAVLWCTAAVAAPALEDLGRLFFPEAEQVGPLRGEPPAHAVSARGELLGYVFRSDHIAPIPAYSGRPVAVAIGLDRSGRIRGLRIIEHEEPILVVGVSEKDLEAYVHQYQGLAARDRIKVGGSAREGEVSVDAISGATITVMVINASVTRAARRMAESRGLPLKQASVGAAAARSSETAGEASAQEVIAPATARPAPDLAPRTSPATMTGTNNATRIDDPIWHTVWEARAPRLWILCAGLAVLTAVLFLQDWLTRHRRLVSGIRVGFLLWTLFFVGWYSLAQLSVVNVFTFVHAAMRGFSWDTFLIEPLIFVLWGFVAVTLLLWGRGVYCGWLCPYGALQELVNKAARRLHLPQAEIPALLHERLLAIKYVILIGLFGLSLHSMPETLRYAEVEPFKTAITLRFDRAWPFVVYALALVCISALNAKFFCKYLCPLGAALTIPAHFRIFDWLKRRRECGSPCRTCYVECPSQAIRPTGEINANECHYCLDCQLNYWDPWKCPPLVERRKRSERGGRKLRLTP